MKITQELLERYHLKQCTEKENQAVEEWLQHDEAEISFPLKEDIQQLEDRYWAKMQQLLPAGNQTPTSFIRAASVLPYAACLLLAAGIALYFFLSKPATGPKKLAGIHYKEVKTARGQKIICRLPDGTLVYLNGESAIQFPGKFTDSSRIIRFRGEGFFTVAKDKSRPFSILTENTLTRVLGTRFNLRAYPGEQNTTVVVEEGKVRFSGLLKNAFVLLTANQKGTFNKTEIIRSVTEAALYTAWKNNKLIFNNERLGDIAVILERWYAVRINIRSEKLAAERYTGEFDNPSLSSVLNSLQFAIKFRCKQDQKTVTLY